MLRRPYRPGKGDLGPLGADQVGYALDPLNPAYIYIYDGLTVGSFNLCFHPAQSKVAVWSVHIDEKFRGQGFGKAMMRDIIKLSRRLGYKHIWLNCFRKNAPAVACYRAVGFELKSAGFTMMEGTLDLEKTKVQRVLH